MSSAVRRSEERRVGSDWSSDVCSSDLGQLVAIGTTARNYGCQAGEYGCQAGLELIQAGHVVGGKGEAEQVQVRLDALRPGGLGDDDDAELKVPAQDHLRGRHAVRGGDLG